MLRWAIYSLALLVLAPLLFLGGSRAQDVSARPLNCWDSACYRTYAQTEAFLRSIVTTYPQIATLGDAGLSWQGARHLWYLRLGSNRLPGPKPSVYLLATQHARDVATPETLLRFISHLASNYNLDPDVTWLLDNRYLWVMPIANPDGFHQVYTDSQCLRIKNMNAYGCFDPRSLGADISRNYPFHWNSDGTNPNPCESSFPGTSALSEPEAQHILATFDAISPNLVISLQAPGPSIRYPWGWSSQPAPDGPALDAFAWTLARLNGTPRSAVSQHNTGNGSIYSGILDDTVYNAGVPAFTLNIGNSTAPVCSDLNNIWSVQRPALLYAAKAASLTITSTLSHSFGPSVGGLNVEPLSNTLSLSAVISTNYGTVASAVYNIDLTGEDGSGISMSGDFGGSTAIVHADLDTSTLTNGRHLLLVQAKSNNDHWGVYSSLFFTVTGSSVTPSPTPFTMNTTTPSLTPTDTFSPSPTPTNSLTRTYTRTPTFSRTPTRTVTLTYSATSTVTSTPTQPTTNDTPTPGCASVTFVNNAIIPVPAGTRTTSMLIVHNTGVIADINLTNFQLQHSNIHAFTISLSSPDGSQVILMDQICEGYSYNLENINLDDDARHYIGQQCPPQPNSTYRPYENLADFNGRVANGIWTLAITSRSPINGSLRNWGLAITFGSPCYVSTVTPTVTATFTPESTGTRTPSPTRTLTYTRTSTYTRTPSPTHTPTYTRTPSPTRTLTPLRLPTSTHTPRPPDAPTPLPCSDYTDVYSSQYFYRAVDWLSCRHIISGYSDGSFRPYNQVSRAQLVKMVVLAFAWPVHTPQTPTFTDVTLDDWAFPFIETAFGRAIIAGYNDGTFRPNANVTRAQLSKIIVLASDWPFVTPQTAHFSDVLPGSAFYPFIETAYARAIISGYGDGTFQPQIEATRGQLCKILYNALTQP